MRISSALALLLLTTIPAAAAPASKAPKRAAKPALFTTPPAREYTRLLLQARRAKVYEGTIVVPVLRATSPVARAANRIILAWARKDLKSFVHQSLTETDGRDPGRPEYGLDAGPADVFVTPRLASVSLDRYIFLGGAHGMTNRFVWRFGVVDGRVRQLNLGDFFTDTGYQKRINDLVMKKLRATPNADWVHAGPADNPMVSALTTKQLNNFSIEPAGLRYTFDPYEMGSYAAGPIEIALPAKDLGPNFRRNWLKQ